MSNDELKEAMKEDAAKSAEDLATQTVALTQTSPEQQTEEDPYKEYEEAFAENNNQSIDEYHLNQQKIAETLLSPCPNANEASRIGNWSATSFNENSDARAYTNKKLKNIPDTPNKIIKKSERQTIDRSKSVETEHQDASLNSNQTEKPRDDAMAWYNPSSEKIIMQDFTDEEKRIAINNTKEYGTHLSNEYISNNPTARNAIFFHELNHKIDFEYNGMPHLEKTPLNAARADRLTETKSNAVEYLATAQQYTIMKQQGIETIQINGEDRPLDNMLDLYPKLKDVIDKNGFDIKDPQSIRNVVQVASKQWHIATQGGYESQKTNRAITACQNFAAYTISEQLDILKNEDSDYQKISEKMLQNTYIGQNTIVDLSGCRDLLDTLDKEKFIKEIHSAQHYGTQNSKANIDTISYEELKAVNDYLESKGLKTDKEKSSYMGTALSKISHRAPDQDKELKELLLSYNNVVSYTDGLKETCNKNIRLVSNNSGQKYQMPDNVLAQAQEQIEHPKESTKIFEFDSMPPMNMPKITLEELSLSSNREQTKTTMQQDRQEHDKALKEKTEELTSPQPTQTEEKSHHTPQEQDKPKNAINPLLIASMQQQR